MIKLKGYSGESYNFEGPYDNTSQLRDNSGVYAILCKKENKFYLGCCQGNDCGL
jgi:hypothetical protein